MEIINMKYRLNSPEPKLEANINADKKYNTYNN
jgi:hypothetical protein